MDASEEADAELYEILKKKGLTDEEIWEYCKKRRVAKKRTILAKKALYEKN